MRVLYLTRGATVLGGREAFAGRTLFDRLAEHADEAIVAHAVVAAGEEEGISLELLDRDVMTARSYLAFDPHVIYFEGGLLGGLGPWRAPRTLLEQSVRSGAVVIVADAEFNELNQGRNEYIAAWDFLRARPNFGADDDSPVYGVDRATQEREFDLNPEKMVVSDWLRPVYEGVDRILAVSPIDLSGYQEILATGDPSNTGTLRFDQWVDEYAYCPFASVCQLGDGYVVFIAAAVSHDGILERCPGNGHWLVNTVRHLRAESARDAARYSALRRLQRAFRDLKTTSESEEQRESRAAQINRTLDNAVEATLRRESAQAARAQLTELFGDLWESLSEQAQRQLVQAEVYRRDAELLADTEEGFEFSAAVGAYSRAVEVELLRRLFEPFRARADAAELPEPRSEKRDGRSILVLQRYLDGKDPSIGEMAFVLMNVGCRLRDDEPNAFAQYLRERLVDHAQFCDDAGFPQRLLEYAENYRNRAMHVDDLSADDCKAARDYLFEEPVRLLLYLTEALREV